MAMPLLLVTKNRMDTPPDAVAATMDRALPPQSLMRKYGAHTLIALSIIAVAITLFMRYGRADTLLVDKSRLTVASVERGPFQEFVPLTGAVAPIDSVYVDIAEPGQVAEIFTEAGNVVEAGQVLVRLTSTAPETELMNSENLLAQQVNALSGTKLQYEQTRLNTERSIIDMRADLEKLTTGYQRMLRLKDSGVIKQADMDDTAIEIKRQQQSLAAMEKSLKLSETEGRKQIDTMQRVIDTLSSKLAIARENLDLLHVRAPIHGQLTSFNVHLGQRVMPAQRIGQIDQIDNTKIVASVDEFYLNRVSVNQSAVATIDGNNYDLKITKVYPEVRDRMFNVDLAFESATPAKLRIGQSMELRLNTSAISEALFVTNGAFYESGTQSIFVLDQNRDFAQRRAVTLGRRNSTQVEILNGLFLGDKVVVSSYQSFKSVNQLRFK